MTKLRLLLILSVFGATACVMQACGSDHASSECVGQTGGQALSVCTKGASLRGVDVSVYQHTVDWNMVKGAGNTFAFVRVSDGATTADTEFANNWPNSKKAGVIRGAYQFFRPGQDPSTQVTLFLAKLQAAGGLMKGDLPPVLDLETADKQSNATVVARAQAWLTQVEAKTGVRPIVYTAAFMSSVIGTNFSKYPLWVANYGVKCPTMPSGWTDWQFWQDSSTGKVPGISVAVDTDYFNGDLAALTKMELTMNVDVDASAADIDASAPEPDGGGIANAGGGSQYPQPTDQVDAGPVDPCAH
jgi:lysozyme